MGRRENANLQGRRIRKIGKAEGRSSSRARGSGFCLSSVLCTPQPPPQPHWLCMCADGTMDGYKTEVSYSWTHMGKKNNSWDSVRYQTLTERLLPLFYAQCPLRNSQCSLTSSMVQKV